MKLSNVFIYSPPKKKEKKRVSKAYGKLLLKYTNKIDMTALNVLVKWILKLQ